MESSSGAGSPAPTAMQNTHTTKAAKAKTSPSRDG